MPLLLPSQSSQTHQGCADVSHQRRGITAFLRRTSPPTKHAGRTRSTGWRCGTVGWRCGMAGWRCARRAVSARSTSIPQQRPGWCLVSSRQHGRPGRSSSPSRCGHLGSKHVDGRFSVSLFSSLTTFQNFFFKERGRQSPVWHDPHLLALRGGQALTEQARRQRCRSLGSQILTWGWHSGSSLVLLELALSPAPVSGSMRY